jgi:hypothetical protein
MECTASLPHTPSSRIGALTKESIVYLGIKGIVNTKRNGNDSAIVLSYALLAFVGVGSATYHTSIKYWAQIGTQPTSSTVILDLNLGL